MPSSVRACDPLDCATAAEIKIYQTQDEANADLAAGRIDATQADALALAAFLETEQGKACCEPEVRLTVKTLPSRLPALQAFFAEHHPYELPQLLWQVMQASPAYADWVRQEVGPTP